MSVPIGGAGACEPAVVEAKLLRLLAWETPKEKVDGLAVEIDILAG